MLRDPTFEPLDKLNTKTLDVSWVRVLGQAHVPLIIGKYTKSYTTSISRLSKEKKKRKEEMNHKK